MAPAESRVTRSNYSWKVNNIFSSTFLNLELISYEQSTISCSYARVANLTEVPQIKALYDKKHNFRLWLVRDNQFTNLS